MKSAGFWNRENSKPRDYDVNLPIVNEARILVLGKRDDASNARMFDESQWPSKTTVIAVGTRQEDFDWEALKQDPPTVVVIAALNSRDLLIELLSNPDFAPHIQWIHSRMAGIEKYTSDTLAKSSVTMTNAVGHFSSTLAEYGMMACSYFAKDLPRLLQQKQDKNWNRYCILELRGATMAIVGYGDIGRATAKLAHAYGMKVIALKRKRQHEAAEKDPYCDKIYYSSEDPKALNQLCSEADYIYLAAPLTPQTRGMIGKEQLQVMKPTAVVINVGRGPVIDEPALVEALISGKIKGAALDVFSKEPLTEDSPLWTLNNVLLSPHNMDKTETFMQEATDFFLDENLPRYLRGLPLYNIVDKAAGY